VVVGALCVLKMLKSVESSDVEKRVSGRNQRCYQGNIICRVWAEVEI